MLCRKEKKRETAGGQAYCGKLPPNYVNSLEHMHIASMCIIVFTCKALYDITRPEIPGFAIK